MYIENLHTHKKKGIIKIFLDRSEKKSTSLKCTWGIETREVLGKNSLCLSGYPGKFFKEFFNYTYNTLSKGGFSKEISKFRCRYNPRPVVKSSNIPRSMLSKSKADTKKQSSFTKRSFSIKDNSRSCSLVIRKNLLSFNKII